MHPPAAGSAAVVAEPAVRARADASPRRPDVTEQRRCVDSAGMRPSCEAGGDRFGRWSGAPDAATMPFYGCADGLGVAVGIVISLISGMFSLTIAIIKGFVSIMTALIRAVSR
nr:hypothetical protein GCM10020063_012510 [Dactylosporangium thailandense]